MPSAKGQRDPRLLLGRQCETEHTKLSQSLREALHANYYRIRALSIRVRLFLSLAGENSDTFSRASYCGCVLVIEEKT